jgi:shikimate 5-dehydrogenase
MTKPRTNPTRELLGIIGTIEDVSEEKRWWNARFKEEGIDAFMDNYPTKEQELPERLSEMFHFDRRGYIVGKALSKAIISLLDHLDASAAGEGRVDVVVNTGGIMTGYSGQNREELWSIWFARHPAM